MTHELESANLSEQDPKSPEPTEDSCPQSGGKIDPPDTTPSGGDSYTDSD